jgi:5-methylcytosine-specific restriction endonuclease McrA
MPTLPKRNKRRSYLPKIEKRETGNRSVYNSKRWHRKREGFPKKYGFICAACRFEGTDTKESYLCDLDHVIPMKYGGDPYDDRNLNRLCIRHHSKKNALENNGQKPVVESIENENGHLVPVDKKRLWEVLTK